MAISLFPHNESAYEAAASMLDETGKAAVIHPTGTGKSFIGFKLCEDNPDKRVCWLSPSEYIFRTQMENLAAAGAEAPENISFFTYARLMLMDEAELLEICPDYIILDEFHRCGAEQWGEGVQRLLSLYPEAKLLGLSATNIRYLDNQRDMAVELFDGNIASEMTLGEAIVRGILNAPAYVLSLFAYGDAGLPVGDHPRDASVQRDDRLSPSAAGDCRGCVRFPGCPRGADLRRAASPSGGAAHGLPSAGGEAEHHRQ